MTTSLHFTMKFSMYIAGYLKLSVGKFLSRYSYGVGIKSQKLNCWLEGQENKNLQLDQSIKNHKLRISWRLHIHLYTYLKCIQKLNTRTSGDLRTRSVRPVPPAEDTFAPGMHISSPVLCHQGIINIEKKIKYMKRI